jgi:DNA polymerase
MSTPAAELEALAAEVRRCRRCPLGGLRTHAVPGEGPADAEIMVIGEAPGYHEDRQGRPFVGPSGQLLTDLLRSIGLTREQVFIANVIKCRPPANRDPLPDEIEACRPYLDRQIALIDPYLIITLGRFSMARFFPPTARITRVHGQPLRLERPSGWRQPAPPFRYVLPLYHPAAALRNPGWLQDLERDFARIPTLLAELRRLAEPASPPTDFEQLTFF